VHAIRVARWRLRGGIGRSGDLAVNTQFGRVVVLTAVVVSALAMVGEFWLEAAVSAYPHADADRWRHALLDGLLAACGVLVPLLYLRRTLRREAVTALTSADDLGKYQKFFDAATDAMVVIDKATGDVVEVNSAARRLYGYSGEGMEQKTAGELMAIPEESNTELVTLTDGMRDVRKSHHRRHDGSVFPVDVSHVAVKLRRRDLVCLLVRDTTERERHARELEHSRSLLCEAERLARIGSWDCSVETGSASWSEGLLELLGVVNEDLGGSCDGLRPHIHAKDVAIFDRAMKSALKRAGSREFNFRIIDLLGQTRHVTGILRSIDNSAGEVTRVIGTVQDVTELLSSQRQLTNSFRMLDLVANGLGAVVYVADKETHEILFANDYTDSLYGECVGKRCWELLHCGRQSPCGLCGDGQSARHDSKNIFGVDTREFQSALSGRWYECRSRVMRWIDERLVRVNVAHEITDRKRLEVARITREKQLRTALVREVHHRIKNHLQSIIGLLDEYAEEQPEMLPIVTKVISQIQSVALVHGIQAGGGDTLAQIQLLVHTVTRSVSSLYSVHIQERTEGNPGCAVGVLLKDEHSVPVALALNELLVNAIKHGRDGEVGCVVAFDGPDVVRLRVYNRGRLPPGFDMRNRVGLGTGLSLVHMLLPSEGVTLDIRQDEGQVVSALEIGSPLLQCVNVVEFEWPGEETANA